MCLLNHSLFIAGIKIRIDNTTSSAKMVKELNNVKIPLYDIQNLLYWLQPTPGLSSSTPSGTFPTETFHLCALASVAYLTALQWVAASHLCLSYTPLTAPTVIELLSLLKEFYDVLPDSLFSVTFLSLNYHFPQRKSEIGQRFL